MAEIIATLLVGFTYLGCLFGLLFGGLLLFTDWGWPFIATLISVGIAFVCEVILIVIGMLSKILPVIS